MTAYTDKTAEISRTPVQLVVVTLDSCSLTYSVGACTASLGAGSECYNTWKTCQDRVNYDKTTKDYKFTTFEAPVPFSGVRPYIKAISTLPTKIEQRLTVKGRRKIQMVDELSDDINIDPYVTTRSSVQGEFWKKLVARNPNYNGRQVKIYEGYVGLTEAQFAQRWTGTLENITINSGIVSLSCVDNLAELEKLKVPEEIKAKNLNDLTDSQTTIVLDTLLKADGVQIDSSGYIQIDDEIISYSGLNVPANQLTGCVRGVLETTAATHGANTRVSLVKYYAPDNPFDITQTILNDAGIDNADIDTTAWAYWKDWPKTDIDYSAIITVNDNVTAQNLFWEIINLLDCHVWQDEDQKITIRRNIANEPGRTYTDLTDDANIIYQTGGADYNELSRRTRFLLYWGKTPLGALKDVTEYSEVDIAIDADSESSDGYDAIKDEVIFCRWFSKRFLQEELVERYAANLVRRKLINRVDAVPIVSASVETKDEAIKTGGNVVLTTDELLTTSGSPISENFMVISRDKVQGRLNLQLVRFPKQRICFIATNGITDYNSATAAEREYGFVANSNGEMPDGDPGYVIW
jgi:hypothetical protein